VYGVRGLTSFTSDVVKLGPYADRAQRARLLSQVAVPVAGLPDARLTVYGPEHHKTLLPIVLFIHGGGWVLGSAQQVASYAKLLASEGYLVANFEYSMAPEHRYPTAILQAAAALNYVAAHANDIGGRADRIFIAGNSAGAQIASQLGAMVAAPAFAATVGAHLAIDEQSVRGLLLFNGVYNFQTVGNAGFFGFSNYAWSYTGTKNYTHYARIDELSTVLHVNPNYPPSFITAGDADELEPQSKEFERVLQRNGVDVSSLFWDGSDRKLPHDYVYDLTNTAAQQALAETLTFLSARRG
jgi:acetyl esterase/lipase